MLARKIDRLETHLLGESVESEIRRKTGEIAQEAEQS